MKVTTDNLIENLNNIGPWSTYGLANQALRHYLPERYKETPSVYHEALWLGELDCESWDDLIIKYHNEVGYKPKNGIFDPDYVNEA